MQVLKAFLGVLEEKPYKWKSRMGNPSIKSTREKRTQVDTTWRKNKSKQLTKITQRPYAKRIHDYKMTINDNKEDLRKGAIIYHKSASDRGALTIMCEKDE
jgi:hypothetical protein